MPATRPRDWTRQEVALLVEQREGYSPRYELVDGELLVTPAPSGRHQRITFGLAVILDEYVRRQHFREVRPLLICEVLSPGSVRHDRITKRRAFQRRGVPEWKQRALHIEPKSVLRRPS